MSTGRYHYCPICKVKQYAKQHFFKVLRSYAQHEEPKCSCGSPFRLWIEFAFGLGAGPQHFLVDGCYMPTQSSRWKDEHNGNDVEYYPFLVVLSRILNNSESETDALLMEKPSMRRGVWLPYWHLVHTSNATRYKYGQWAPFMYESMFRELLEKAIADGYLTLNVNMMQICNDRP